MKHEKMKLEDAMLYCLITEERGLSIPQLIHLINSERLCERKDGSPITEAQVWACYFRNRHTFVLEGGIIHVIM